MDDGRRLAQRGLVGVGRAPVVPRPVPGLGHHHPELGAGLAGRQRRARLEGVVGRGPVAPLFPGRAGEDRARVADQRRAGELLKDGTGVVLGPGVVVVAQGPRGAEKEEVLEDGVRGRAGGDQLVELGAEEGMPGPAEGGRGEQLQAHPAPLGVPAGLEELEKRALPDRVGRARDKAQQQPVVVGAQPLLRRQRQELVLQQGHGVGLAPQGVEHGRVGPGEVVAGRGAAEALRVEPGLLGRPAAHRAQEQPRLLPLERESGPLKVGRPRLLGLAVQRCGAGGIAVGVRQDRLEEVQPGTVGRGKLLHPRRGQLEAGRGQVARPRRHQPGPQVPGGSPGAGVRREDAPGLLGPVVVEKRGRQGQRDLRAALRAGPGQQRVALRLVEKLPVKVGGERGEAHLLGSLRRLAGERVHRGRGDGRDRRQRGRPVKGVLPPDGGGQGKQKKHPDSHSPVP